MAAVRQEEDIIREHLLSLITKTPYYNSGEYLKSLFTMDVLEQYHQTEVYCIELIIEFFVCHNFQNSLIALRKEAEESDFYLPAFNPKAKERIQSDQVPFLMKLFHNYDHEEFFVKWTSLVPDEIRSLTEYKKLTIYLYTYFATMKYRNYSGDNKENLSSTVNLHDISNENITDNSNISEGQYPVQKLEKSDGTFIIEKTIHQESLPIVTTEQNLSNVEKIETDDEDLIRKQEDDESSNREFEADSLENESDSNDETDSTALVQNSNFEYSNSAMEMFKTFLSENGSEFTNDPEFLPFFALPFVQNPRLHPSFTKVFDENWLNNLKQTLQTFLINYSCGDTVIPRLVQLCLKEETCKNVKQEVPSSVSDENTQRLKEVRRKFHRLKKDHQKLVGVASELSSALEKSVQGEAVNLKSTLANCIKIFPDLFSVEVPYNQPIKWQTGEIINNLEENKFNYNQIDVRKIRYDLIHGSIKNKLLLLQALRWFITKCKCEEREQIISWFCRQDLLGLKSSFISDSLAPITSPHPIQQSVVRILNALASFNTGRDYITSSKITVQLLLDLTKQNYFDSVTEDMIIATLQKLSLRRRLSDLMVKNDILERLLTKLDTNVFKKYTLEYCTSLIMNLAICIDPSFWDTREHYVYCLIKLLKTSHRQVLEFVCGTLCCIVRSEVANIYCRNYGLKIILSDCLTNHNGDDILEKQIETLLRLHNREIVPDSIQMNSNFFSDDDLDDPEELESEIEENDPVKGNPSGENLLSEQYRLVFTTPSIVGRHPSKSPKLILRPSSPRFNNIPSWARSQ